MKKKKDASSHHVARKSFNLVLGRGPLDVQQDVMQGFALEVGHGGVFGRVADGKEQEQLLVGRPLEQVPELWAAVERRRRHGDQTHVLTRRR